MKRRALIIAIAALAIVPLIGGVSFAAIFWQPVSSGTPLSAYFDLDTRSGYIRDWTGWTGTSWVYGHAYDAHTGTDYDGATGDPVYNILWGTVTNVVNESGNTYPNGPQTLGTYVRINHGNVGGYTYQSAYGHLEYQSPLVSVDDYLGTRQQIADMDNTGYSSGAHLHLTLYRSGTKICPYNTGLMPTPVDGEVP